MTGQTGALLCPLQIYRRGLKTIGTKSFKDHPHSVHAGNHPPLPSLQKKKKTKFREDIFLLVSHLHSPDLFWRWCLPETSLLYHQGPQPGPWTRAPQVPQHKRFAPYWKLLLCSCLKVGPCGKGEPCKSQCTNNNMARQWGAVTWGRWGLEAGYSYENSWWGWHCSGRLLLHWEWNNTGITDGYVSAKKT